MYRATSAQGFRINQQNQQGYQQFQQPQYRPATSMLKNNNYEYNQNFQNQQQEPEVTKDQFVQFLKQKYDQYPELKKNQPNNNYQQIQQRNENYRPFSHQQLPQISGQNGHKNINIQVHPKSAKSMQRLSPKFSRPQSTTNIQRAPPPLIIHIEEQQNADDSYQDLRDKLWDQVYFTKNKINDMKEKNNNIRAKIWNIEKENRKMQKQIESWNLEKGVIFDSNSKAFVDSVTTEKVFKDENFNAVTMKQQLKHLKEELKQKDEIIKDYKFKIKNFQQDAETIYETVQDQFKEVMVNCLKLKDMQNPENGDNIEELLFQQEDLSKKIKELQQVNKVIRFEIEVQRSANIKSENEKVMVQSKLEKRQQEIEQLQEDLKAKGVEKDFIETSNFQQKRRVQIVQQKSDEELLEEREKQIAEQKKNINELDYNIQNMTLQSILNKQDNLKEIKDLQHQITLLEEKYILLLSQYNRDKRDEEQQEGKSIQMTLYNSEVKVPSLSYLPSHLIDGKLELENNNLANE